MFEYFKRDKKKMSSEKIQILQLVAQQVVLSLESSVRLPGPQKKVLATQLVNDLMAELQIAPSPTLVDTAIEASVTTYFKGRNS